MGRTEKSINDSMNDIMEKNVNAYFNHSFVITITEKEAETGCTKCNVMQMSASRSSGSWCYACNGTGDRGESGILCCRNCHGMGVIFIDNFANKKCEICNGLGRITQGECNEADKHFCRDCHGSGKVTSNRCTYTCKDKKQ